MLQVPGDKHPGQLVQLEGAMQSAETAFQSWDAAAICKALSAQHYPAVGG